MKKFYPRKHICIYMFEKSYRKIIVRLNYNYFEKNKTARKCLRAFTLVLFVYAVLLRLNIKIGVCY